MENIFKLFSKQMNPREQLSVGIAVGVVVLFILFQLIIMPLVHKHSRLEKSIASKKLNLNEMIVLKAEYENMNKSETEMKMRLRTRSRRFTLYSFLDDLAGKVGIKSNIISMKPKSTNQAGSRFKKSIVEMKLEGITTEQLTTYLHGVETSRNMVYVKRVSVSKKGKDDQSISVVLQVETIEV